MLTTWYCYFVAKLVLLLWDMVSCLPKQVVVEPLKFYFFFEGMHMQRKSCRENVQI